MKETPPTYVMPNMGCLLGTAYQVLLGQLSVALEEARMPVTSAEYLVLRVLYNSDGLRQCDIAATLCKDKAAVCRCVTGMVKKGLVTTRAVSHKCQLVYLTAKAKEIESQIMGVALELDNRLKDFLTTDETEILRHILIKIIENK